MSNTLARPIVLLPAMSLSALVVTIVASAISAFVAIAASWPLWAVGVAAIVPWIPSFTAQAVSVERSSTGLGLFYVLVVTQGAHFLEHVAQMIQIHGYGLIGPGARGVIGVLDVEWVH